MAKLTLTDLTSQYGSTTAINANNALIETALENTLSRDGTTPNSMSADLDMGTNEIINLKAPTNNNNAARLQDVVDASASLTSATAVTTTIVDSGGNYTSDNVEGALEEIVTDIAEAQYNYGETNSVDRAIYNRLRTKAYVSDWSGDLSQAITDISTDETTLVIDIAVDTAGTPVTQPSTLTFEFTRAGSIDDSVGGGDLTANGPILAGQWQIFGDSITLAGTPLNSEIKDAWFGVTGNGTTDDTTALQAANDFAELGSATLRIKNTPLVSATITIDSRVRWKFDGPNGVSGSGATGPWSFIKKDAAATGAAVLVESTAKGVIFEGGGIEGVAGNTGDGLVIQGNSCTVRDFSVLAMGNDGIRIGKDTSGGGANNYYLDNIYVAANGNDGLHIADIILGGASNANAGQVNRIYGQSNTRHGLYVQNAGPISFVNAHFESNGGWGIYLDKYSEQVGFYGGDTENNTTGNVYIDSARYEVSGAADNGAGLIRITTSDTSLMVTGEEVKIEDVVGTTEANGWWTLTVIDATNFDLQGSTFSNAYVSGGKINNFAGSHGFFMHAYSGTFTDNGWLTSNHSTKGSGGNPLPSNASGTWTPIILGSDTAGTPTYGAASGTWVLNGDTCTAYFTMTITATTGMVGNVLVGSFPFLQADAKAGGWIEQLDYVTFPAGTSSPAFVGSGTGTGTVGFNFLSTGAAGTVLPVANLQDGGNSIIRGVVRYKADLA